MLSNEINYGKLVCDVACEFLHWSWATISHNEYKDVLLNKKCLRHSVNRTQSKDHKIGTYEIKKIDLSCFDDKMYIQSNECDGLALGY